MSNRLSIVRLVDTGRVDAAAIEGLCCSTAECRRCAAADIGHSCCNCCCWAAVASHSLREIEPSPANIDTDTQTVRQSSTDTQALRHSSTQALRFSGTQALRYSTIDTRPQAQEQKTDSETAQAAQIFGAVIECNCCLYVRRQEHRTITAFGQPLSLSICICHCVCSSLHCSSLANCRARKLCHALMRWCFHLLVLSSAGAFICWCFHLAGALICWCAHRSNPIRCRGGPFTTPAAECCDCSAVANHQRPRGIVTPMARIRHSQKAGAAEWAYE